jgi:hypothetical protein
MPTQSCLRLQTTCLFGCVTGSSSAELASVLEPFARQLLGPQHRWASTTWGILICSCLPRHYCPNNQPTSRIVPHLSTNANNLPLCAALQAAAVQSWRLFLSRLPGSC